MYDNRKYVQDQAKQGSNNSAGKNSKSWWTYIPLFLFFLLPAILNMLTPVKEITWHQFENDLFKTQPLNFKELLYCMPVSFAILFAVEIEKSIKTK
jgi:hypothetical protein